MTRQVDMKALISHIVSGDGADKCRICMGDTSEGQVYLGDTVMMDGDKAVSLSELLELITGVEVPMDDELPPGLCRVCTESAKAAMTFRALCLQATDQWLTSVTLLNSLPDIEDIDQKKSICALIQNNKITVMDVISNRKNKILIKKQEVDSIKKEVRTRHVRNKITKCKCPDCGKQFRYPKELHVHLLDSTENKQACFICASIEPRDQLASHLKNIHNRELFYCNKCPAMLSSMKQLRRHKLKHGSGAYSCAECGRSFKSLQAQQGHITFHDLKHCPNCDKLFPNRRCYLYHVKKCCGLDNSKNVTHVTKSRVLYEFHKDNKKLKMGARGSISQECFCDYCGKKFAGKKFVNAHIQIIHTKTTHRPCIYCGKSYAAAVMTEHLKKHEEVQSFTCDHCGCILKTRLGYIQHIRLHTGEKPYKCSFCSEMFSASSRRSEHIRKSHKPEQIISKQICKFCPAKFKLPYQLKNHVETVHNENLKNKAYFECPDCHIKFSSCRGMLHHRRKHQSLNLKHLMKEQDNANCANTN